jgi:hypothetical protein
MPLGGANIQQLLIFAQKKTGFLSRFLITAGLSVQTVSCILTINRSADFPTREQELLLHHHSQLLLVL